MSELSLDMLFPNPIDKENSLLAFASVGDNPIDPYAHLSDEEKEKMHDRLKLISNKIVLPLEEYKPISSIIEPELSDNIDISTQVEVLKKFNNYQVGDIINSSELSNLSFLLKFNIVKNI